MNKWISDKEGFQGALLVNCCVGLYVVNKLLQLRLSSTKSNRLELGEKLEVLIGCTGEKQSCIVINLGGF